MNFEERDKAFIKSINSNLLRAESSEEDASRIKYSIEVVNDATVFSLILKERGDFKHSREYIETAMNVNRVIMNMLQREHNLVFMLCYSEKEKAK